MEDLFEFVGDLLEFVCGLSEGVTDSNTVSRRTKSIIITVVFLVLIFTCVVFAIGLDTPFEK